MRARVYLPLFVSVILGVSACGSKENKPAAEAERPTPDAKAEPAADEKPAVKSDDAPAADAEPVAQAEPDCDDPANADKLECGGKVNVKPDWLTRDIIAHKSVVQESVGELQNGQRSWLLMLELDEKTMDTQKCITATQEKLSAYFKDFDALPKGSDGRESYRSNNGQYIVTVVCGINNKSQLVAYFGVNPA